MNPHHSDRAHPLLHPLLLGLVLLLTMASALALPVLAQEGDGDAAGASMEKPAEGAAAKHNSTQHAVTIDGQKIDYTATAGWLILKNQEGKPTARFGYTAYTRNGVSDLSKRPVMFAFNGGPGSSSIWLHMGVLGPRRVVATDAGHTPPPPSERQANEYSIIDVSDLVMIDPVGTGFSKPVGEGKGSDFWGVDQDVASVAQFIKLYITENGRWASPKYVLGESYGGIRAAGLSWHLQSRHGMNLNGVILVSPFLNMGSGIDGGGIDLPHVLYFPTLAATAWYHDLLDDKPESIEDYMTEVESFAYQEYAPALLAGYTIDSTRKQAVAEKLARYTGTEPGYWLRADLRVSHPQFLQELQRNERVVTGRIDSRFTGPSVNPLSEAMDYDPFFPAVGPAFTAAFLDYLHSELKFGQDEDYRVSAFGIDWDWSHRPPGGGGWEVPWANLRADLAMAMTHNPGLHLLVQQGYYDLATPLLATKHDIEHLDITEDARERIRMAYYEAGHMMYLHQPSLEKYRDDLASFVRDTDRVD
ncbi:MAG: carboxypeptidase [Thermoanaerobaculia bacterium]|nr:carboxypeptidase [Thermoanaerobaculia bacterium]